jgi:hypothetical protein
LNALVLRQLAALMTIALVVFALLAHRSIARGDREMQESDRAFDSGRLELAVLHARRAAAAYVPGAQHVAAGFDRLRAVARGAERERQLDLARDAWGAVRAAAIESRHLWQPHPEALREADAEFARLSPGASPTASGRLPGLRLAALGGLVLGGALALIGWGVWRARDDADARERPRARLAALACLVGVIVWSVALLSA